jgi:O-methyltransferase
MASHRVNSLRVPRVNVLGSLARRLIPVEFQPPPVGVTRRLVARTGYFRLRTRVAAHGDRIPDESLYQPLYSPWLGDPDFERVYAATDGRTLVSRDRCYVLWRTLQQALALDGELLECGVFRGGTALLEATTVREAGRERSLHLVDSFAGMPETTTGVDRFREGDFATTSADDVRRALAPFPFARVHQGYVPEILERIELGPLAWAYIDVDIYAAVRDCLEFVYPRLLPGGTIVLDDYGFPSCPGVRRAMDEFFAAGRPEVPLCLPTGQGLVAKLP